MLEIGRTRERAFETDAEDTLAETSRTEEK